MSNKRVEIIARTAFRAASILLILEALLVATPPVSAADSATPQNMPFSGGTGSAVNRNTNEISVEALQWLAHSPASIPNLRMVSGRILRGGQPNDDGLSILKQAGVKTIINLRTEDVLVEHERKVAKSLGLKFVHIPMYTFDEPDKKQFKQFFETVASAEHAPVFVHCLHGQDRTGTMIGAYRIVMENWRFDKAFQEMMECGFRPGFTQLTKGLHELAVERGDKSPMPSSDFVVSDLKRRIFKRP